MGLHELYYAESPIAKALPARMDLATNHNLESLRLHMDEAQKKIDRLDEHVHDFRKQPSTSADGTSALDAAIVATAQSIGNLAREVDLASRLLPTK